MLMLIKQCKTIDYIYKKERLNQIRKADLKHVLKQIWNCVLKYQKKGGKRIYSCRLFIELNKKNVFEVPTVRKRDDIYGLTLLRDSKSNDNDKNEKLELVLTYVFWK